MRHKIRDIYVAKDLPKGVRLIAWARTIRWIGWGFGESLIPLFIFQFSHTFAEAGLLRSTYEIVMLLALPLIGAWVDRVSAKRLILIALTLYPLVGLGYFFAGVFGAAIFIVLARGLNGFIWGVEDLGVSTYYRRIVDHDHIGSSFGYIDTWSNLGWILAAVIGMFLVSFVSIHYLLLAISPFAIIALFVAARAPADSLEQNHSNSGLAHSYKSAFSEWRSWNSHLWLLGTLTLFSAVVNALMWFFIPIDAYINGAKPAMVVLLTVIAAVPTLFGYKLGKLSDRRNNYLLISFGLFGVALTFIAIIIFPQYLTKLIASFFLSLILELFSVIEKSLVTTLGPSETYGQRGGAFESVVALGDLGAPLILGITLDLLGFASIALIIFVFALVLAVSYLIMKTQNPSYAKL